MGYALSIPRSGGVKALNAYSDEFYRLFGRVFKNMAVKIMRDFLRL